MSGSRAARWPMARAMLALLFLLLPTIAACQPRSDLPDLGPAPPFRLIDQTGTSFSSEDVHGRVVIADFMYTTCTDACPVLSAKMREMQQRLKAQGLFGNKVLLLSFTVDPRRDTPDTLAAYAAKFGADATGWRFLTGEEQVLRHLLQDGFKVGFPDASTPRGDDPGWLHSSRFVVVDRDGRIRAYPGLSDLDLDALLRDVEALAR